MMYALAKVVLSELTDSPITRRHKAMPTKSGVFSEMAAVACVLSTMPLLTVSIWILRVALILDMLLSLLK